MCNSKKGRQERKGFGNKIAHGERTNNWKRKEKTKYNYGPF